MCGGQRAPENPGTAEKQTAGRASEAGAAEAKASVAGESNSRVGDKTESGKKPEVPVSGKEFDGNGVS